MLFIEILSLFVDTMWKYPRYMKLEICFLENIQECFYHLKNIPGISQLVCLDFSPLRTFISYRQCYMRIGECTTTLHMQILARVSGTYLGDFCLFIISVLWTFCNMLKVCIYLNQFVMQICANLILELSHRQVHWFFRGSCTLYTAPLPRSELLSQLKH